MPRDSSPTIQELRVRAVRVPMTEPLRVDKGMALVGDAIGTGIDWNEDAVRAVAA